MLACFGLAIGFTAPRFLETLWGTPMGIRASGKPEAALINLQRPLNACQYHLHEHAFGELCLAIRRQVWVSLKCRVCGQDGGNSSHWKLIPSHGC